jgi:hypothetical protein
MKRKKHGLGWYFGMTFGDPIVLADLDAPGLPRGGPKWMYIVMWIVIGLILAAFGFVISRVILFAGQ